MAMRTPPSNSVFQQNDNGMQQYILFDLQEDTFSLFPFKLKSLSLLCSMVMINSINIRDEKIQQFKTLISKIVYVSKSRYEAIPLPMVKYSDRRGFLALVGNRFRRRKTLKTLISTILYMFPRTGLSPQLWVNNITDWVLQPCLQ